MTVRDPSILKALGPGLTVLNDTTAAVSPGSDPEELVARIRRLGFLPRVPEAPRKPPEEARQRASGREMKKGEIFDQIEDAYYSESRVEVEFQDGHVHTYEVEDIDESGFYGIDLLSRKTSRIAFRDIRTAVERDR